jgi:hypothetical protein
LKRYGKRINIPKDNSKAINILENIAAIKESKPRGTNCLASKVVIEKYAEGS